MAAGAGDAGGSSPGRGTQGLSALPGWEQHLPGAVQDPAPCPLCHTLALFSPLLVASAAPGVTRGSRGEGPRGPVSVGASRAPVGCWVSAMFTEGQPVAAPCPAEPAAQLVGGQQFLGCHEPGLAPVACLVTLAQLPRCEGTLWCPCSGYRVPGTRSHQDRAQGGWTPALSTERGRE